jgi:hypothetical protein
MLHRFSEKDKIIHTLLEMIKQYVMSVNETLDKSSSYNDIF